MIIKNFKELEIWKRSMNLALKIYQTTRKFPKSEMFGITDQMRRASCSVPSNIAEGWTRSTNPSKIHFLDMANSSLSELETFSMICEKLNYLNMFLYGSAIYAVFDFTNLALFYKYSLNIAI